MERTIYLITHYSFNHQGKGRLPLDDRFLHSCKNYVYYLIDEVCPPPLEDKRIIFEKELDPILHKAGSKYLAEWSFLLAEAKHSFCAYPFFMISSRFYEKNRWLYRTLDQEWNQLFDFLDQYGFGFLPSYDRPLRWISVARVKDLACRKQTDYFCPFKETTFQLGEQLFDVKIPQSYRFTADLFCNYIGFKSREDLLNYVCFYSNAMDAFFDTKFNLKIDLNDYFQDTRRFRKEKPITFFLEFFSHLFFFKHNRKFFSLHYDGYYEIDEVQKELNMLHPFKISSIEKMRRLLEWRLRWLKTESRWAPAWQSLRKRCNAFLNH